MTENNPSVHVSRFTPHASSLDPFFNPAGVAVIGASANTSKLSHGILRNLVSFGYRGAVYPVNPGRSEILGLPCYPTITVVPDPLDLAVIVVPAPVCPAALHECGVRGVKAAINIALASGMGAVAGGLPGAVIGATIAVGHAAAGLRP